MTGMAAEEGLGNLDPSEVIELGPGDEGLGDVHPGEAVGIVGALVGGYVAAAIFDKGDVTGVSIESIVIAVLGAIVVLFVYRMVMGRRTTA
jgi:uncharacterized membrane protein YeaQ/YmgE (transglycosylase-associated protein family)